MISLIICIAISFLLGILLLLKIRSYDIYEKEPIISMSIVCAVGGFSSVILSGLIYYFLNNVGIEEVSIQNIMGSFLIIGPVEEGAKLVGLIIAYQLIKKQVNEISDGIVYISCVALGFSLIENIMYASQGSENEYLVLYRVILCTPAHLAFSGLMGYAYYRYKFEKKPLKIVFIAFLVASVLHGIYDAIAFTEILQFLLAIYVYIVFYQLIIIMQLTNLISPNRPKFIEMFKEASDEKINEIVCPNCQSTKSKLQYKNKYFAAYKCEDCGYYISSLKDIKRIFKYFAPEYKDLTKEVYPVVLSEGKIYMSIYACTYYNKGDKYGFFDINKVERKIAMLNTKIVDSFYSRKLIPTSILAKIMD